MNLLRGKQYCRLNSSGITWLSYERIKKCDFDHDLAGAGKYLLANISTEQNEHSLYIRKHNLAESTVQERYVGQEYANGQSLLDPLTNEEFARVEIIKFL